MENQVMEMTPPTMELSQNEEKQNKVTSLENAIIASWSNEAMGTLQSINASNIKIELQIQGESVGQYNCYTFQSENIGNIVEQLLQLIQVASLEVYQETGKVPFGYQVDNIF